MSKLNNPCLVFAGCLTGISTMVFAVESNQSVAFEGQAGSSVMLANEFHDELDLKAYWYSEKLDGIRAIWTGDKLLTRNGNTIHAPQWFIDQLPNQMLDGELWAGRGNFQLVQKTVLDDTPNQDWQNITFMVFDIPTQEQIFTERYQLLEQTVNQQASPFLRLVQHQPLMNANQIETLLQKIEANQGEGVMLRNGKSLYQAGRSDDLIKLKSFQDSEAIVIGYKPGNGKYQGLTGSLLVKWQDGKTFYLGSGLSDDDREAPPALGSQVNFRYNGLTANGLPRFARFVYVREEG